MSCFTWNANQFRKYQDFVEDCGFQRQTYFSHTLFYFFVHFLTSVLIVLVLSLCKFADLCDSLYWHYDCIARMCSYFSRRVHARSWLRCRVWEGLADAMYLRHRFQPEVKIFTLADRHTLPFLSASQKKIKKSSSNSMCNPSFPIDMFTWPTSKATQLLVPNSPPTDSYTESVYRNDFHSIRGSRPIHHYACSANWTTCWFSSITHEALFQMKCSYSQAIQTNRHTSFHQLMNIHSTCLAFWLTKEEQLVRAYGRKRAFLFLTRC